VGFEAVELRRSWPYIFLTKKLFKKLHDPGMSDLFPSKDDPYKLPLNFPLDLLLFAGWYIDWEVLRKLLLIFFCFIYDLFIATDFVVIFNLIYKL